MADAAQALALTNAINALATAIANIPAAAPPPPVVPPAPSVPIHHLFSSGDAFDLSTRSGNSAFKQMLGSLEHVWDVQLRISLCS